MINDVNPPGKAPINNVKLTFFCCVILINVIPLLTLFLKHINISIFITVLILFARHFVPASVPYLDHCLGAVVLVRHRYDVNINDLLFRRHHQR